MGSAMGGRGGRGKGERATCPIHFTKLGLAGILKFWRFCFLPKISDHRSSEFLEIGGENLKKKGTATKKSKFTLNE